MIIIKVILIIVAILFTFATIWRYASRRWSLPCPAWLAWSLESRLLRWFLHTERTLSRIGMQAGQQVLEVGPGPGRLLIPAAKKVLPDGEVSGLDIQEEMIEELMSEAKKANVHNLQGIVGDARTSLFEPESFDLIYVALTLGEIPNRQSALQSCYEALKPGGVLSITEFFLDPHFTSKRQAKRLAEVVGFKHEKTFGQWWSFTSNFKKEG